MTKLKKLRCRIHDVASKFTREAILARVARKKREKKVLQNLHKLPAEIRLLILDEYVQSQPPTVIDESGRLHHPLIDDQTTKLDPKAYHSIFHSAPLKLHRSIQATETPLKRAVIWPNPTLEFLTLHDRHCKRSAREQLQYELHCTITVPTTCDHHKVIFYPGSLPSDPSQRWFREKSRSASRTDPTTSAAVHDYCSAICLSSAHRACKIWHEQFMLPNEIHWRNVTKFEVVFVKETMMAKLSRWAKRNPGTAIWKTVLWTAILVFAPVVLVGLLGYLLPYWSLRISRWLNKRMGKLWVVLLAKMAKIVARIRRCRCADGQMK
ncbi:hypothetical protein BST61_g2933 [Cercospora zeina]